MKLVYSCNGSEVVYYSEQKPFCGLPLDKEAFSNLPKPKKQEKKSVVPYHKLLETVVVRPNTEVKARVERAKTQEERFREMRGQLTEPARLRRKKTLYEFVLKLETFLLYKKNICY